MVHETGPRGGLRLLYFCGTRHPGSALWFCLFWLGWERGGGAMPTHLEGGLQMDAWRDGAEGDGIDGGFCGLAWASVRIVSTAV